MIREAIILAGGLGTRLREAVPDLPKCMAPVAGRPFLSFVIDNLRLQGIEHFIFSLGYKSEAVIAYLEDQYPTLHYTTVVEEEPLGTGGAIALSLQKALSEQVLVANGDTLFKLNVSDLFMLHTKKESHCTIALKPMEKFDRYGVVQIDADGKILSFQEKKHYEHGLINGGIYLVNKAHFQAKHFPKKFSFEQDYLEAFTSQGVFYGSVHTSYFIDIGIPQDFEKANQDLKKAAPDLTTIDKTWSLFLDRDGVINEEKVGHYVLNKSEFNFIAGSLESFALFKKKFGRIIIVSNQRGVGKGLMSEDDLLEIHKELQNKVQQTGSHIDQIYYCTDMNDRHTHRKPNPGMALQATLDFPDIDLSKSIMVGNKPSDMRFGRSAGMFTVFVTTTNPDQPYPHPDIDLIYADLISFARDLPV